MSGKVAVLGQSEMIPTQSDSGTIVSMFERMARDPSVPMDRIERVMDMLREMRRDQAEEEFNNAMADTQRELTPVARDSFNPQTRSKYASYHAIDKAIRPVYTKHGLGVSFDEDQNAPEGFIRVLAFVSKGRHTKTFHYDSPVVTAGLQGKTNMTLTHARASAVTYAKRYLVGMIFNLSTGEDEDGNNTVKSEAEVTVLTAQQLKELKALIVEVKADETKVCLACHVEALEDLTVSQYEKAKAKLEAMRTPL